MAEKNEELQKQLGKTPGATPIKGAITRPDTEVETDEEAAAVERARLKPPPPLPPAHRFTPKRS